MTAVEWLFQELERIENMFDKNSYEYQTVIIQTLEEAKEIEKQQIVNACNQKEFEDIDGMGIHETITKGEQYYEQIIKNK